MKMISFEKGLKIKSTLRESSMYFLNFPSGYTAIKSNEGWDRLAIAWQTSVLRRCNLTATLSMRQE